MEFFRVSETVYGIQHSNEAARARYLDGLINKVVFLFGETVMNKPKRKIGGVTKYGAIQYQFVAFSSIAALPSIEANQVNLLGSNLLKAIARVMAESDGRYNAPISKNIRC